MPSFLKFLEVFYLPGWDIFDNIQNYMIISSREALDLSSKYLRAIFILILQEDEEEVLFLGGGLGDFNNI